MENAVLYLANEILTNHSMKIYKENHEALEENVSVLIEILFMRKCD